MANLRAKSDDEEPLTLFGKEKVDNNDGLDQLSEEERREVRRNPSQQKQKIFN